MKRRIIINLNLKPRRSNISYQNGNFHQKMYSVWNRIRFNRYSCALLNMFRFFERTIGLTLLYQTVDAGCKPYMAPERIDPTGNPSNYDVRSVYRIDPTGNPSNYDVRSVFRIDPTSNYVD